MRVVHVTECEVLCAGVVAMEVATCVRSGEEWGLTGYVQLLGGLCAHLTDL